jgi:hypothetical protein
MIRESNCECKWCGAVDHLIQVHDGFLCVNCYDEDAQEDEQLIKDWEEFGRNSK